MITKLNTSPTATSGTGVGMGTILLIVGLIAGAAYYFINKNKKEEEK